jgi:hypothetical protein
LNAANPTQAATRSAANVVDNVERIDVPTADWEAGEWKIVLDVTKMNGARKNAAVVISPNASY